MVIKGVLMNKQYVLALVALLSLPGCWWKCRKSCPPVECHRTEYIRHSNSHIVSENERDDQALFNFDEDEFDQSNRITSPEEKFDVEIIEKRTDERRVVWNEEAQDEALELI